MDLFSHKNVHIAVYQCVLTFHWPTPTHSKGLGACMVCVREANDETGKERDIQRKGERESCLNAERFYFLLKPKCLNTHGRNQYNVMWNKARLR